MEKLDAQGWTRPKPLCGTTPEITSDAQGKVRVSFVVHRDGKVDHIEFAGGDSAPWLFESVRTWLSGCTWSPARDPSGKAVASKMVVPFNFHDRRASPE